MKNNANLGSDSEAEEDNNVYEGKDDPNILHYDDMKMFRGWSATNL